MSLPHRQKTSADALMAICAAKSVPVQSVQSSHHRLLMSTRVIEPWEDGVVTIDDAIGQSALYSSYEMLVMKNTRMDSVLPRNVSKVQCRVVTKMRTCTCSTTMANDALPHIAAPVMAQVHVGDVHDGKLLFEPV